MTAFHWLAQQMALIDSSDTRFTLVCAWILLATLLLWTIGRGRKKP